jgi:hypothetical protein
MTANSMSRKEKYDNIVLNYNFPHLGEKLSGLPAPSLEDIGDTEKKDRFTAGQEDL